MRERYMKRSIKKNIIKKWFYFPCYFPCYFLSYVLVITSLVFGINTSIAFADVTPNTQIIMNQTNIEHVVWNKVPISFVVPIGAERMISFPDSISLHNTDPALTTDKLLILNNAGTLYIKAKKAFGQIRIPIVLKKSGEVMLLDLSAAENSDDTPVQVLLDKNQAATGSIVSQKSTTCVAPVSYAGLMRYVVQHLYSPKRLLENDFINRNAINRTPMYTTNSIDLVYREKVIAMPLISWRGGDLYVTAVLLKNLLKHRVRLSPINLKGQWLAAAFYPTNYVTAKGTVHDRTTLFLISNRPFNEALNVMRGYR